MNKTSVASLFFRTYSIYALLGGIVSLASSYARYHISQGPIPAISTRNLAPVLLPHLPNIVLALLLWFLALPLARLIFKDEVQEEEMDKVEIVEIAIAISVPWFCVTRIFRIVSIAVYFFQRQSITHLQNYELVNKQQISTFVLDVIFIALCIAIFTHRKRLSKFLMQYEGAATSKSNT